MMGAFHDFIHACQGRVVTRESALSGLAAGAAAGAAVTSLPFVPFGELAFLVFLAALMVWAVGVALIGAPIWWGLHRLGLRCWSAAMTLGAVLAPLSCLLTGQWAWQFALFAVPGAVAGLTVWSVAYRKPGPDVEVFC